ncbi:phosphatidate cytidylyltransferase [Roseateles sp. BYS180W]|uniref:Phosphatidate cytidylyltransferase n=1 Tax=Roseateles rivi TaxID=3299028 RepID=A0ABW7FRN7_9BURK
MNATHTVSPPAIATLFLVLLGGLSLTSLLTLAMAQREQRLGHSQRWLRFRDELGRVWLGAAWFWLAWWSGPWAATLLFGLLSFLVLREFITLTHTRRADHRALVLAFFVFLPLQYLLVGLQRSDLFNVLIPVYAFLIIPVVSALGDDPRRFLERNAKVQWGVMVCVYGLSHAPALLLLSTPEHSDRGALLLFFLVLVVAAGKLGQAMATAWSRRRPLARRISRSFSLRSWLAGAAVAALAGAALHTTSALPPLHAAALAALSSAAGGCGELVMQALKRDAGVQAWGNRSAITGAVGLLDRLAPLCFAAPVFFHAVRML